MDNVYEAYLAAGGSTGLDADGYTRLLKTLCADLPDHLVSYVFESLQVSGRLVALQYSHSVAW